MEPPVSIEQLVADNTELRARLAEAEEALHAIHNGEVDALVVAVPGGERVFTLQGADHAYRLLVEEMSEGALILTAQGVVYYANRRLAEMLRVPLQQVIGADFERWVGPADRVRFRALTNPARPELRQRMEITLLASDATPVPCYLSVSLQHGAEEPGALCLVATDLTEQKRNEAIVAAEKLARLILDQTAEAIVVCDNATQIIRASKMANTLCGEDPLGQVFDRIFPLLNADGEPFSLDRVRETSHRRRIEARLERPGAVFHLLVSVGPLVGALGERLGSVVILTDITQRKAAEEQIEQLAFYDPLTRLPNRRLLLDRLHQAVKASLRTRRLGALLFLDLDDFKTLNDTLGHDIGDLLLQQVANRLVETLRGRDTVARLGGDEFVVLMEDLGMLPQQAATHVQAVGEKLLTVLNQPFDLVGHRYHNTSSIGVALIGEHPATVDELLKRADLAMYQAKAGGGNSLRFFDPEMQTVLEARTVLEAQLREGLREGQFLLLYQAQVDDEGHLTGAEALLRWRHPQRGLVMPGDFIPLAEETGLILPLGDWVLETACAQLAAWAFRPETADLTLAVNISAREFRHPGFVERVRAALARQDADPHRLRLEITESLLLQDVGDTIDKMNALKAHGVSFALDDFGTGYSSLGYLKRLPLNQLKIDRSFVSDLLTDPNDAVIARTIVALGQNLGLSVIAEGVETEDQRGSLLRQGCRAFQGYLFGRPAPAESLWGIASTSG